MSAAAHITPVIASVTTTEPLIQKKLMQSYLENVSYLPKKFANNQAIDKIDSKILHYILPAHMSLKQYSDDLCAKSSEVTNIYDESSPNDSFVEGFDHSICQSLREYSDTVLTHDALLTFPAISKGKIKKKDDRSRHQRSPRPGTRLVEN